MISRSILCLIIILLKLSSVSFLFSSENFHIKEIKFYEGENLKKMPLGVTFSLKGEVEQGVGGLYPKMPQIEVTLMCDEKRDKKDIFVRVYFYDDKDILFAEYSIPFYRTHQDEENAEGLTEGYFLPAWFSPKSKYQISYLVDSRLIGHPWRALVVFGDKNEMDAKVFPAGSPMNLEFDEKPFFRGEVEKEPMSTPEESAVPLIEKVIETNNPKHPRITLFLMLPPGVKSGAEVRGLFCNCLVRNNLQEIRADLLNFQKGEISENSKVLRLMQENKFAILTWAARKLWTLDDNFDREEDGGENSTEVDQSFKLVGDAWRDGVLSICEENHLPKNNWMIQGGSAAGNWVHRIAMLHPDLFCAVHSHISSCFTEPKPESKKVLWLLTTGELDIGYQNAVPFYQKALSIGFPIIFKAEPNLYHTSSPKIMDLANAFFRYAFESLKSVSPEQNYNQNLSEKLSQKWTHDFQSSNAWGNGSDNTISEGSIPADWLKKETIALPTPDIAKAWK